MFKVTVPDPSAPINAFLKGLQIGNQSALVPGRKHLLEAQAQYAKVQADNYQKLLALKQQSLIDPNIRQLMWIRQHGGTLPSRHPSAQGTPSSLSSLAAPSPMATPGLPTHISSALQNFVTPATIPDPSQTSLAPVDVVPGLLDQGRITPSFGPPADAPYSTPSVPPIMPSPVIPTDAEKGRGQPMAPQVSQVSQLPQGPQSDEEAVAQSMSQIEQAKLSVAQRRAMGVSQMSRMAMDALIVASPPNSEVFAGQTLPQITAQKSAASWAMSQRAKTQTTKQVFQSMGAFNDSYNKAINNMLYLKKVLGGSSGIKAAVKINAGRALERAGWKSPIADAERNFKAALQALVPEIRIAQKANATDESVKAAWKLINVDIDKMSWDGAIQLMSQVGNLMQKFQGDTIAGMNVKSMLTDQPEREPLHIPSINGLSSSPQQNSVIVRAANGKTYRVPAASAALVQSARV